jgi:hypothetical protein
MRRVIVYKGMTDIVKEVFMTESTYVNTDYPNCEFEIDEFDYGNIDVSKTAKELDVSLKKAIGWLNNNGFTGKLITYNTNKAEFIVSKDDVEDTLTLTSAIRNPKKVDIIKYMNQFGKSFEMKKEIERLRAIKEG